MSDSFSVLLEDDRSKETGTLYLSCKLECTLASLSLDIPETLQAAKQLSSPGAAVSSLTTIVDGVTTCKSQASLYQSIGCLLKKIDFVASVVGKLSEVSQNVLST